MKKLKLDSITLLALGSTKINENIAADMQHKCELKKIKNE